MLREKHKGDDDTVCRIFACWVAPRLGGYAGVINEDERAVEMLICSKRIDVKAAPKLVPATSLRPETLPESDHAALFRPHVVCLPPKIDGGLPVKLFGEGTHLTPDFMNLFDPIEQGREESVYSKFVYF